MKKQWIVGVLSLIFGLQLQAQESSANIPKDESRVELRVVIPEDLPLNSNMKNILRNRLEQAVVLNGLGSSVSRFLLVPHVSILSKEVAPSAPPMYVTELEVTCFIVDQIKQTVLQQSSITAKGIANNDSKSISKAITSIQARNGEWKKMIVKGKKKIVRYYETECAIILKKVESDITRGNFEDALLELESMPKINLECYETALKLKEKIDQKKRDSRYAASIQTAIEDLEDGEPDVSWVEP